MLPDRIPADAALFLDFDGCLVEIAPTPDAVRVPPELPPVLSRLHDRLGGAVALISGRAAGDLRRFLPGFPGAVAGSHGAELSLPGQPVRPVMAADGFDVARLQDRVRQLAAPHPALLVEPKPHGVVLHYRAAPDLGGWVTQAMIRLAGDYPMLALQPAKMAVELRPAGAGKDRALAGLMAQPPFAGRLPVYAGDDLTDEAAIAEAQALGGFGVKVGPGDSAARHRLPDPAAVLRWLEDAA
ncbi:trehalose-phosphatase [Paracoccus siganidrum]|uniref:Trehalose 6-phosphate phosphatase n=1 Tax=Paracoccus siganidrum TaxID=1276757 RepID=A0A418ZRB9_9RHOB|nr:trehalose-phosphatase [Paracoccus siganidrum]RJK98983.1 trehalose-phosphatase [Paracoccus siganidrum]RMC41220.1 trehalose-phosphatase [Paracoccus siganidrum]